MPKINVDGKPLPPTKANRLKELNAMMSSCKKRMSLLNEKSPYQPYKSVFKALKDIWYE